MTDRQAARRKLISAASATPLILTVRTASATAVASNVCMDRDKDKPMPVCLTDSASDEWMRGTCTVVKPVCKDSKGKEFVVNKEYIQDYKRSAYYELAKCLMNPPQLVAFTGMTGFVRWTQTSAKWALVKIDRTSGNACAWWWEPHPVAHKCTKSCYTSLRPKV
jgi:hypothetical protein